MNFGRKKEIRGAKNVAQKKKKLFLVEMSGSILKHERA